MRLASQKTNVKREGGGVVADERRETKREKKVVAKGTLKKTFPANFSQAQSKRFDLKKKKEF